MRFDQISLFQLIQSWDSLHSVPPLANAVCTVPTVTHKYLKWVPMRIVSLVEGPLECVIVERISLSLRATGSVAFAGIFSREKSDYKHCDY